MDSRKRFLLLLVSFSALLTVILLLSVRNSETSIRIRRLEISIARRVEEIRTLEARVTRVVYITMTPTPRAIVRVTATVPRPTHTPLPAETSTPTPSPTPTFTSTPSATPTETATPTAMWPPTSTSTPTPPTATASPTAAAAWTATATPTPRPAATNTPRPPTPTPVRYDIGLVAYPPAVTADGVSSATIRATVRYWGGALVPDGTLITFSTDRGVFGSSSSTAVATSGGIADAHLTSTSAGAATVTASAAYGTASIQVSFLPGPPWRIDLSATPAHALADGSTPVALQATVVDAHENPVSDGTTIVFSTTLGVLAEDGVPTIGGRATVALRSEIAGQATVSATHASIASSLSVRFQPFLHLDKTVDRVSAPGGSVVTYTIAIHNATMGGEPAHLQLLTDTLPAGFQYVPGSARAPAFPGEPAIVGQHLVWSASPIAFALSPGSSIQATFRVTASAPAGTYPNVVALEGPNFDPLHSGPTAQVTLLDPILGPMLPVSGCSDQAVPVRVNGTNFAPGAVAQLGAWDLQVAWVTPYRLEGTVPGSIPPGSYDLTVTNPGGASATLIGAYTALDCSSTTHAAERSTPAFGASWYALERGDW